MTTDIQLSEINRTIHKLEALKTSRDIRQIAADSELLLTPIQRGRLYWAATRNKGSITEKTIKYTLHDIILELQNSETALKPLELNWKPEIAPVRVTSIISKSNSAFQWELDIDGDDSARVDQQLYTSADVAKEHADRFVSELKKGNERSWITYGITSWVNQQKASEKMGQGSPLPTKIELLQIGVNFYVMISSNFAGHKSPTLEVVNRKTEIFSNILLEIDVNQSARESVTINPKWVARGVISDLFYVLFQVISCDSLPYIVYKLKTLFTKADLT